ncbi:helix-turn-helix domain-containing protein [Mangrovihabitans endophyticus]|uniref:helix-turn-helix domain-containing protein n=1 Tax=Mangrovihabitans endophyticus TaxID=1751298 RepID=UPI0016645276|nr:helix-turn-helix transcriptional regulator [Mangrovihabitans endophyticus]
MREAVALNVRAELAKARISGTRMAAKIGIPRSTLGRRIAGEVSFDAEEIAAIARVLQISTDVLLAVPAPVPTVGAA